MRRRDKICLFPLIHPSGILQSNDFNFPVAAEKSNNIFYLQIDVCAPLIRTDVLRPYKAITVHNRVNKHHFYLVSSTYIYTCSSHLILQTMFLSY